MLGLDGRVVGAAGRVFGSDGRGWARMAEMFRFGQPRGSSVVGLDGRVVLCTTCFLTDVACKCYQTLHTKRPHIFFSLFSLL